MNGIGRLTSISKDFYMALPLPCLTCRSRRAVTSSTSLLFSGSKCLPPAGRSTAPPRRLCALTEGLRMELHSQNIRCTMISPGAIATELAESSSDEATRKNLREFMKMAIPADSIARAIAYAIEQPADVEIDEIVVRPIAQDF